MKQAVLSVAAACVLALPALPSHAQVFQGNCPALGDVAQQISGWRKKHKTKAQAIAQSHKYYGDGFDAHAVDEAIETIYGTPTLLNPDQASMIVVQNCLKEQTERTAAPASAASAAHP